ncbi:MAG: hypothetical protein LBT96_00265 [Campylobacteraceae bacterium]|jgi:hypothetical protein|nr:hypothetical protein [Campylobacteraceae bacterium]
MRICKSSVRIAFFLILCAVVSSADVFEENEQRNRQRDIFESLSKDPTQNVENFEVPKITPAKPSHTTF